MSSAEASESTPGRICVTGSSGLLGQAVVAELLDHGYRVLGADRLPPRTERAGFTAVQWDGCDVGALATALSGSDGLVHLAAIPAPGQHPDEVLYANNTRATFAALQAASQCGIRRAVIASSISIYGMAFAPERMTALYVPIDEEHPLRACDPYALSKEADEATARMFARRNAMSIAALRFHWVADRQAQAQARSARGEVDGESEIRNLWGYVDDRDAGRACRLALARAADAPYGFVALNIVAADVLATQPLAELITRYAPEVEIRRDPGAQGSAWDSARAEAVIGWRPEHSWRQSA